jgi:hypothetical protein
MRMGKSQPRWQPARPGKQAVGGGYSLPPVSATTRLHAVASLRSSPQTWTVGAINKDGSASATAYAYCRNTSRSITDVPSAGTVPSGGGQAGSASSTCPTGTRLIGGGFSIDVGPGLIGYALPTSSMSTSAGSWSTTAVNATTGAHTLTNHAYCMSGIAAPAILTATLTPTVAEEAGTSVTSPTCPPRKKKGKKKKKRKPAKLLSAGGFGSQSSTPIVIVHENRINATTWLDAGTNLTGPSGASSISAQGICF